MKRLEAVKCIDQKPADQSKIFFGAWVVLENEAGDEVLYRIVGSDEIDTEKGWISVDSPLARALLKKTEGDEVAIQAPKGAVRYWVVGVGYEEPTQ